MLADLLPADVVAVETAISAPEATLFAAERSLVAGAVAARRAEFATARHCARRALAELGIASVPIPRGPGREPLWPEGIVGSITHCAGYHAAAVGRTASFCSIGIDAEPNEPLPDDVLDHISSCAERVRLPEDGETHFDRVLFSAKEATYKTWFPLTRRWLDFDQASVAVGTDNTFEVRILGPRQPTALHGRWLVRNGLILTAIALPNGVRVGS